VYKWPLWAYRKNLKILLGSATRVTQRDKYIRVHAPLPCGYICRHFGIGDERISAEVNRLRRHGLIRRVVILGGTEIWH